MLIQRGNTIIAANSSGILNMKQRVIMKRSIRYRLATISPVRLVVPLDRIRPIDSVALTKINSHHPL